MTKCIRAVTPLVAVSKLKQFRASVCVEVVYISSWLLLSQALNENHIMFGKFTTLIGLRMAPKLSHGQKILRKRNHGAHWKYNFYRNCWKAFDNVFPLSEKI